MKGAGVKYREEKKSRSVIPSERGALAHKGEQKIEEADDTAPGKPTKLRGQNNRKPRDNTAQGGDNRIFIFSFHI